MAKWLKKVKVGIPGPIRRQKGLPDGVWNKCPSCKKIKVKEFLEENYFICSCDYHFRIGSHEYFNILFDNSNFKELFNNIRSSDPLNFYDTKSYKERLIEAQEKTHFSEAVSTARGEIFNIDVICIAMDFSFIGGSIGSAVGEKIVRAINLAEKHKIPLIMISKSSGARLMESTFSLMQMVKISANLALLKEKNIPYISVLTDPTTGEATASFAMLGDFNIAEPNALIGYAGPKVIRETIGRDLPKGFQTSEFLLEHGFIDFIVNRKVLKDKIGALLSLLLEEKQVKTG